MNERQWEVWYATMVEEAHRAQRLQESMEALERQLDKIEALLRLQIKIQIDQLPYGREGLYAELDRIT